MHEDFSHSRLQHEKTEIIVCAAVVTSLVIIYLNGSTFHGTVNLPTQPSSRQNFVK